MRLVEIEPEPSLEALRSHALDLVLADEWTGAPRPRLPGLDREDLFTEPVGVVLPAAHPAAGGRGGVRLADLAGEPWAAGSPGGGMDLLVRRVCNEHGGFEPAIHHHTNELTMLIALAADGHALTLLPEIARAADVSGVVLRPVAGADLWRTVFTAAREGADRRPALAAVREAVRAAAASRPGVAAAASRPGAPASASSRGTAAPRGRRA